MQTLQKHVELLILTVSENKITVLANVAYTISIFIAIVSCAVVIPLTPEGKPSAIHESQRATYSERGNPKEVRLVLQVSKKRIRVGETIEFTAYLENASAREYYVGNGFVGLLAKTGLHDIELKVVDNKSKEVEIGRMGGSWIWKHGTSMTDKLSKAYVILRVGAIHGLKQRLSLPLTAGQYHLTATYREEEALQWAEKDREVLEIPVWTKPLVSNMITITVVR